MSLKPLFSSFLLNTLPLLLRSSSLALSFSVPLLLSPCSPSQPEPEKRRDQTQVPSSSLYAKVRPSHYCTSAIPSHSFFYSTPFLPAPEKLMLFVMMFCPPPASVYSLTPPPTHQPLTSISCLSVDHPSHKRRSFSQSLFYTSNLNH